MSTYQSARTLTSLERKSLSVRLSGKLPNLALIRNELSRRDALYWAQNWTETENPKFAEQGLPFKAPFPKKDYFEPLFREFYRNNRLFVCKSREMITSWSVLAYATNRAQYHRAEVVIQTDSEDKARELVGYGECLYRNQPDWLKSLHPLLRQSSSTAIEWKSGGRLFGIPKGVHKIRMFHPTIVIFDEAAFLPEFQQSYDTAHPVAGQIIAISSAGPGAFADLCES